jgi:hypothetical protein
MKKKKKGIYLRCGAVVVIKRGAREVEVVVVVEVRIGGDRRVSDKYIVVVVELSNMVI